MTTLPFNLFDVLLAIVLIGGIVQGRKHGISEELLSLVKWLMLLFGCAAVYQPAGNMVAEAGFFDPRSAYLMTYLGAALMIFLLFSIVERRLAPKLVGSDIFGRGEYFLGMGSGMLRFACVLLMGLSLLHARQFTPAELKAMEKYQVEVYGSHVFPSLHSLQVAVFERSFTGYYIKQDLSFLLIDASAPGYRHPSP